MWGATIDDYVDEFGNVKITPPLMLGTLLEKTGLKRQYDRETVEGWGQKEAAKARGQARTYENNKNLEFP